MKIIFSNNANAQHLGGKANHLFTLTKLGLQVPAFCVIAFDQLQTLLDAQNTSLQQQKNIIAQTQIPLETLDAICNYLGDGYYAVRSSGGDEDGSTHSFAGQYSSELFVSAHTLQQAIISVWLSAYSDRVLAYRAENKLMENANINIIIQCMVHSKVSGVAFGANPLTGNIAEQMVNAVWGLGEGLVSGDLDADQYKIDAQNIVQETIACKTHQFVLAQNGGLQKIEVPETAQKKSTLSHLQMMEIKKCLLLLQNHFHHPQDIEFAYNDNDSFFVLQSRPITTAHGSVLTVFDNSNIIESYPGLTSPLTFSFIQKMYESVYRQLSSILGVRQTKIDEYASVYAAMLEHIKGRVYYNLNHWYMSLAMLPGYALNASFMEKMMGVKESFSITPPPSKSKWQEWMDVLYAIQCIFKTHQNIKPERKIFQQQFKEIADEYAVIDFSQQSLPQLVQLYQTYENTLVKKWKAPLINDFFAMIYFGLLQKQVAQLNIEGGATLHNELLAGSGDIISTEPTELCFAITKSILQNAEAHQFFNTNSAEAIWEHLCKGNYPIIKKGFDDYLHKWGARCVGELKLETITYNQQPHVFVGIIKNYLQQGITQNKINKESVLQIRYAAEQKIFAHLSFARKPIFKYILKQARDLVSNRENLRYERTKGFAIVRNLFLAMDAQLLEQNLIKNKHDIFWLEQQEVYALIETKNAALYQSMIAQRKQQYAKWQTEILPERLQTYGNVQQLYFSTEQAIDADADMKGLPCCAGIVRAKVCVLHSPLEASSLNGNILVTSSTDPGWVTLFPTASAILVERGSLLSHSAIVSREMGIPCITGIPGLLQKVKTGDVVEMNGSTGTIKIIEVC
jgi:rifampicin phosphotransferase